MPGPILIPKSLQDFHTNKNEDSEIPFDQFKINLIEKLLNPQVLWTINIKYLKVLPGHQLQHYPTPCVKNRQLCTRNKKNSILALPLLRERVKKFMTYPLSSKELSELHSCTSTRNDAQWVRCRYILTHRWYMVINFLSTFGGMFFISSFSCFQDIFLGKVPQKRDAVE